MPPILSTSQLSKQFKVPTRQAGLKASFKALFRRTYNTINAVEQVSFQIEPGEVVGFLGPNGAGKTTTLKMLTGLLHPSGGQVQVLGFEPYRREHAYLRQITLVMGNRNQLAWDLPALDSYELNQAVYNIPQADFIRRRDELIELLEIGELVRKPVRNLSLGERMKAEIVGALLHSPRVLFLDEPTIGLDVTMQRRIRAFIAEYNRREGATVLLTSHYMADVEALCKRVIVIHHGRLLFDGALSDLVKKFSAFKTITIDLPENSTDLSPYGEVLSRVDGQAVLRIPKEQASAVTSRLLAEQNVADLTVEDTPIDDVIDQVFSQAEPEAESV